MAINTDYKINTEEIKSFISNWFHVTYGSDTHADKMNQINQSCISMSEEGYNLLENTNLITIHQHRMLMEGTIVPPYYTGFQSSYTGKPLIQSIIEDKNLAQHHMFYSNPHYLNIRRIIDSI